MAEKNKNIKKKIDIVLLGASTGGPKVLYDLITSLPGDLNVPVAVVQHMPAEFTKVFADRINENSNLRVKEAENDEKLLKNTVYIAPGGYHMTISVNTIKLDTTPQIHGVRPAVDKLFMSAADCYNGNILSCIFTGMGHDGAEGVKKIKSKGGYVLCQDEATSVIYGMPKAAFETGCVDMVLPDYKFKDEIVRIVRGL